MRTVAYIYFPTPSASGVEAIFKDIFVTGVTASHFGVRDPPKKRSVVPSEMASEILGQPEQNKYAFIRDASNGLDLSVELMLDPRWVHSAISIGGKNQSEIARIAKDLSVALGAFLSIIGTSGGGKGQSWLVIHESSNCPPEIKNRVRST